jgi:hypothetical protein
MCRCRRHPKNNTPKEQPTSLLLLLLRLLQLKFMTT